MYREEDICLVIPTYQRAEDVDRSLGVILERKKNKEKIFGKIIIVDQSKTDATKKTVQKYKSQLPVEYVYSPIPSSSIAENIGVKKGMKDFPLLLVMGDDVDVLPGFCENIVKEFNQDPKVFGVGGVHVGEQYNLYSLKSRLSHLFLRMFFLPYKEYHKFRVIGPYGFTATPTPYLFEPVRDAQWIPGFNNCFKREVYETYSFPEIPGYNVLEDIDCSYTVYKKYGPGSLVITPYAKSNHRESAAARYAEKKRIFVNHEDHFSFYYRHFNTLGGRLKMMWSVTGILFGNFLRFASSPSKLFWDHLRFNVQAVVFCYKNQENIRAGIYRLFLKEDLTMREDL